MGAIRGAMANFPQSRLIPLTVQLAEWVQETLKQFPFVQVAIGQPEPRLGPRGMGREGPGEMGQNDSGPIASTQQQAEQFCRAMAALQEEFLVITLASRLAQADLSRMLAGVAQEASVPASQQSGMESISTGLALPISLSGMLSRNVATAYGQQRSRAVSEGVADSEVRSHVEGKATTHGYAVTDGTAHTVGTATSSGGSSSHSISVTTGSGHVEGQAHTEGKAHTEGQAVTKGRASSSGGSSSHSTSVTHVPAVTSVASGETHVPEVESFHQAASTTPGYTTRSERNIPEIATAQESHSGGGDARGSIGVISGGVSGADSYGESRTPPRQEVGYTETPPVTSGSVGTNTTPEHTVGSQSQATTPAHSIASQSSSRSSFHSTTRSSSKTTSQADTVSEADTESQADSTSESRTESRGHSSFSSTTHSVADTVSHAETRSWATTQSEAEGEAHGQTRSHGVAHSEGSAVGRSLGRSLGQGFGVGLMPSFGLSRSYQWFNDPAVQLTAILRAQEEMLRQATLEGAYLTDVYLLTRSEEGAAAAEVAVRQAFQGTGPLVVTPVQTRYLSREEQRYIRLHAATFTPSTREEPVAGALEAYRDASLLLPLQLAAYTAPVLFEEGLSVTTQERIPAFAFVPDMDGDVVLAHQWSTERAALTQAPLRLSEDRFFHTVFAADTGYGKTVAAERLVVETTQKWHHRSVVLDFGAGWRKLLNSPEVDADRVEVWQLFPGATAPFRWNPWQVGKRIQPDRQLLATCEIFKNSGRMGARQLGFMRRAARELYLEYGVLTADEEVLANSAWNRVRSPQEDGVVNAARQEKGLPKEERTGVHLSALEPFERQALAVHRSKQVDMAAWVRRLRSYIPTLENKGDRASVQSLEGALLRLEVFTQGEVARMYGSGEGTVAVEDLGLLGPAHDRWGISILEGGAEMDEYAKIAVLGLVAWHLYNDAVVRRRESIGKRADPVMQIVFEEANKILTGIDTTGEERTSGATATSEQFQGMWRDGRKYRIFLHPIVQTVSALPAGILASCNNAFFSQTKNPADRDLMMSHLAFSEKGFTDEDYKRFLSRMAIGMAVCKLGYSSDVVNTTPFLVRPSMVRVEEPSDAEIWRARR